MILAQRTPLPPPLVAGEIVQASWGLLLVLAALRIRLAVMRCRMSGRLFVGLSYPSSHGLSAASPWQRDGFACLHMHAETFGLAAVAACTL